MATSATIVYLYRADLSPRRLFITYSRTPESVQRSLTTMHILKTHHRKLLLVSLLLIADLAVFCLTNTETTPSFMLILGFLLLSATVYWLIKGLVRLARFYGIRFKRQKRITLVLTIVVSSLIALQSIGQLGLKDIVVGLIIAVIYYLYSSYAKGGNIVANRETASSG